MFWHGAGIEAVCREFWFLGKSEKERLSALKKIKAEKDRSKCGSHWGIGIE